MSKNPNKPGLGAGKTPGTTKGMGGAGSAGAGKGSDPKHLPREFKYFDISIQRPIPEKTSGLFQSS